MDENFRRRTPGTSLQRLPESIPSLLGVKTHLTPTWVQSVCHIIKDLTVAKKAYGSPTKRSPKDVVTDAPVSKLCSELALLDRQLNQLNLQRRQALNDFLDLKGNIRVFCRVRPHLEEVIWNNLRPLITSDANNLCLKIADNKIKQYSFDKVFHSRSTQEEVFAEIQPVIKSALDGYNVCIFAYGQTGTGKTFTMEGRQDSPGVVPRGIKLLFKQALERNIGCFFTFSMLEIYMGSLRDLLVPRRTKTKGHKAPCLSIQMDPGGGVDIENLTAIKVVDFDQVERHYKLGIQQRSTACTNANSTSSRSHCLIRMSITCNGANERRRKTNKIWMVDLGGSERLLKTQASGRRLQEGKAINLSLSALGDVISALQSKKQHVPYRNSKLTQVLRDSLGTDSKTLMLVHVSPREEDLCETICSLGFATRVRSVHLGSEEPEEVRAKKEEAMAEMLDMVNHYESKCQDVSKDIEMLKELLRNLAMPEPLGDRIIAASHLSSDGELFNVANNVQHTNGPIGATRSLPGFMRQTVCSQRKMGMNDQALRTTWKKPPLPSRKKSSSVYGESITSSVNGFEFHSNYGSECGKSTISFLKGSVDDGSEYSQNASEYDIKKVIFSEKDKSDQGSMTPLSHESTSTNESERSPENRNYLTKKINIENWLHHHTTKKSSMSTHGTKRVLAIPAYEANRRFNEQNHGTEDCNAATRQYAEATVLEKPVTNVAIDARPPFPVKPMTYKTDANQHQNIETAPRLRRIPENQKEILKTTKEIEVVEKPLMDQSESFASKNRMEIVNIYSENPKGSRQQTENVKNTWQMRSQISCPAIDQKHAASEAATVTTINLKDGNPKIGMHRVLWQTFQMLWSYAQLGFGIQSLGYGEDFFHGLML